MIFSKSISLLVLFAVLEVCSCSPQCVLQPPQGICDYAEIEIHGVTKPQNFNYSTTHISGEFTSESSTREQVDAFWYQGYERALKNNEEVLVKTGEPVFVVRFSPRRSGAFQFTIRDDETEICFGTFNVSGDSCPGFLRVSQDQQHFEDMDGKSVYLIGENLCWSGTPRKTYDYDNWLKRLADVGANYIRIWSGPFDMFTLETVPQPIGTYLLENAWHLDYVMQLAKQLGIHVEFCFESFNSLRVSQPYPYWNTNPYNAENGGMLSKPEDFFHNQEAINAYMNRIRYIQARWGAFSNIIGWQWFNEVDIIETYDPTSVLKWQEMVSKMLRDMDIYKHLQSTSFSNSLGTTEIEESPCMDYISTHTYNAKDMAADVKVYDDYKWNNFKKPHFVEEYGLSVNSSQEDPDGIMLHNGVWSAISSISAGGSMLWWWDSYVDPMNLYSILKPATIFTKMIPYAGDRQWNDVNVVVLDDDDGNEFLRVQSISNGYSWSVFWLQNTNHTYIGVKTKLIERIQSQTVSLTNPFGKVTNVEVGIFDCYEGVYVSKYEEMWSDGNIQIKTPAFDKDVAMTARVMNNKN